MSALTRLSKKQTRDGSGFTLIEVIVTLAIFIILTASVFGIMTAVFESSNALKENQNRRDEVSALRAYLKSNLENLTATDHFVTYRRGDGEGLRVNGLLLITQGITEAIDATRQPNGLYTLRLAQPTTDSDPNPTVSTFSQELDKNVEALAWTSLIHDVRSISWQFQSSSPPWLDEWTSDSTKPTLVECTIQLAGDEQPTTMDFSIPHLVVSPSQMEVASHAP